jgi:hypothetical protein
MSAPDNIVTGSKSKEDFSWGGGGTAEYLLCKQEKQKIGQKLDNQKKVEETTFILGEREKSGRSQRERERERDRSISNILFNLGVNERIGHFIIQICTK